MATIEPARDERGRFMKGITGNPGGRPAIQEEIKDMLKNATAPAVELLTETMRDDTAPISLRIKCAETILDRVYGKAAQPIEAIMSAPAVDLSDFTIDELRRIAAYDDESDKADDSTGSAE
jgi:hypothetical protein